MPFEGGRVYYRPASGSTRSAEVVLVYSNYLVDLTFVNPAGELQLVKRVPHRILGGDRNYFFLPAPGEQIPDPGGIRENPFFIHKTTRI